MNYFIKSKFIKVAPMQMQCRRTITLYIRCVDKRKSVRHLRFRIQLQVHRLYMRLPVDDKIAIDPLDAKRIPGLDLSHRIALHVITPNPALRAVQFECGAHALPPFGIIQYRKSVDELYSL